MKDTKVILDENAWRYCYECPEQVLGVCKYPGHIRHDLKVEVEKHFMAEGCRPSEMNEAELSAIAI